MERFFSFFKKLFIFLIIAGAVFFVFAKRNTIAPVLEEKISEITQSVQQFPQPTDPVEQNFSWKFKDKTYEISLTLYQSIYSYYQQQPKSFRYYGELPADWEQQYYTMFLNENPQDVTITNLANEIVRLGQKNRLTEDQMPEFILSFVQAIPYDDAKAKDILAENGNSSMDYPYELLFEKNGVCSDKSILAAALLRKLGYGAAFFLYEQDNHMTVAVQCPNEYSTYGSGFCYAETTSTGYKIGIIPSLDVNSNKTVQQLGSFEQQQQLQLKELGQPKIINLGLGKEYIGIVATLANIEKSDLLQKEISGLTQTLSSLKKQISQDEEKAQELKKKLEKLRKEGDIDSYNDLVKKYNDLIEQYQDRVALFNKTVSLYNQKVKQYNAAVAQ